VKTVTLWKQLLFQSAWDSILEISKLFHTTLDSCQKILFWVNFFLFKCYFPTLFGAFSYLFSLQLILLSDSLEKTNHCIITNDSWCLPSGLIFRIWCDHLKILRPLHTHQILTTKMAIDRSQTVWKGFSYSLYPFCKFQDEGCENNYELPHRCIAEKWPKCALEKCTLSDQINFYPFVQITKCVKNSFLPIKNMKSGKN